MSQISENNKRIAKNTLLLYFRMLLIIIVGLYTSRVVLNTLGVSDYGIYNVVGGIVAMLAFLNSAMVAASQRFISFELGTGNIEKLKKVFCTSVSIHIALAGIIFLIAETIGLWFVNTHLNIPAERMEAANWVYQCSILTLLLTVVSVPYNSCIVAHEHMKAFAYVSIVEAVLKLLIVYLLLLGNFDKLILYAILVVGVALIIRLIYGIYCKLHFEECTYRFVLDKQLFREMFAFAGWSVIGNLGFSFREQSANIILNWFCGATINAARGIAMQVNGIISNFSNNLIMALAPQITKQYAAGEIKESIALVYAGCRYSFYLLALISIPVWINIDYLLNLWLGIVPQYTADFLRLTLVTSMINAMSVPIAIGIRATGKIKSFQIATCIILFCELPLSYWILSNGCKPYMAMYPTIALMFADLFVRFLILKKQIPAYSLKHFVFAIAGKNFLLFILGLTLSLFICKGLNQGLFSFLLSSTISCTLIGIILYFLGLTAKEKSIINKKIVTKVKFSLK